MSIGWRIARIDKGSARMNIPNITGRTKQVVSHRNLVTTAKKTKSFPEMQKQE